MFALPPPRHTSTLHISPLPRTAQFGSCTPATGSHPHPYKAPSFIPDGEAVTCAMAGRPAVLDLPLEKRKARLRKPLPRRSRTVFAPPTVNGRGRDFDNIVERHDVEGIIAKRSPTALPALLEQTFRFSPAPRAARRA